jgi:HSP20 family protein
MSNSLLRFDPASEMRDMTSWMDRFFGHPLFRDMPAGRWNADLSLPVDIYEKDSNLVIKAAIPGVNAEDLDISIEGNVLTIRGETKNDEVTENDRVYRREYNYGSFTRSIRLPENLNTEQVEATADRGFVYVTLPKTEEAKPKSLKVPVKPK